MANIYTILLVSDMSLLSWLGIVSTIMMGILGFLLKDAYARIQSRIDAGEKETKKVDDKVNELHFKVLEKLDQIKDRINEVRK